MSQSRRQSMVEAIVNVCVGLGVNLTLNFAIFPLFGWVLTLSQNMTLGVIYTAVSLVRSYCLRRVFNRNAYTVSQWQYKHLEHDEHDPY